MLRSEPRGSSSGTLVEPQGGLDHLVAGEGEGGVVGGGQDADGLLSSWVLLSHHLDCLTAVLCHAHTCQCLQSSCELAFAGFGGCPLGISLLQLLLLRQIFIICSPLSSSWAASQSSAPPLATVEPPLQLSIFSVFPLLGPQVTAHWTSEPRRG